MSQDRLSNDEFLTRLAQLFENTTAKHHGSVFLTQKRLTPYTGETQSPSTANLEAVLADTPAPILIRATNGANKADRAKGQKIKFSTVVDESALGEFYVRYAEVWKVGMSALKRRDKKKKNKAKKKKTTAQPEAAPVSQ
ncbi:signal recognition particle, SRP9/SRP14 subunit [Ascobolus immersus RN42]|uniref:Signal recognition particle subunit SRP14 n=1 Tax=Ascobolus immersus RN42 TaxID=1160509 RepID=A0A3N4I503_ASCIM|nr:signal recognition particle, SRP9/SRP14 subunit [Ascobolus immersus RN42]